MSEISNDIDFGGVLTAFGYTILEISWVGDELTCWGLFFDGVFGSDLFCGDSTGGFVTGWGDFTLFFDGVFGSDRFCGDSIGGFGTELSFVTDRDDFTCWVWVIFNVDGVLGSDLFDILSFLEDIY